MTIKATITSYRNDVVDRCTKYHIRIDCDGTEIASADRRFNEFFNAHVSLAPAFRNNIIFPCAEVFKAEHFHSTAVISDRRAKFEKYLNECLRASVPNHPRCPPR